MNPEEQFARLKHDDDRWENTRFAGAGVAASVERRRLPLWGQLTIGIAAGLIVGLVITLGVTNLRHDALPPAVSPSPTVTPGVPGAVADDGFVMNRPFADHFASEAATPEPVVAIGSDGSAPWAVMDASPDDSSLTIAYVASGDFGDCGVHKGVDVVESDSAVTITLVVGAIDEALGCTDLLRLGYGTVNLDAPLGSRALFHGPLTTPWDEAASPLLTVDPTLEVLDVGATCDDFLYDQTTAGFEADKLSLRPKESYSNNRDGYAGEILDSVVEGAGEGDWVSGVMVQYGGLVCRWEAGETYLDFGFGPITAEQSAFQQARLEAAGWLVDPDSPYPLLYRDGMSENYAFGDGWWAYENNQSGTGSKLYEIIATSPHPEAFSSAEVDSGEEFAPVPPADPDAYVTTAGYGDLKLGARVPEGTKLVDWFADDCAAGRWGTPGSEPKTDPITVRTTSNGKNDPILWISIYSPDITTKSGAHVGMSYTDLTELLPNAKAESPNSYSLMVVSDNLGKVVFEVEEDEVKAIHVVGANDEPFGSLHGDAFGACYGA